ncbi:hypothetical protein BU23DRAFT_140416 [Bimuria novae-zelandiae CBS 107.79]|uniref:Uncharacterized protein n=1 Tax=Bimuria novae-zelandiae CBS 107.79 TaxID=1447943 RepID=A0A6A5VB59_9PLEO|nr:hypothetical protein BU23DRAFT_140416 [Bimuria novae-zelandiae CBS 107.79]
MHASLILLVASLAASAVAAPMPIQSPAESPEPLKVRKVDENTIIPAVENLKREIFERLDTIVLRSIPDDEQNQGFKLSNDKRRLASGTTGVEPNYKRDAREYSGPSANYKREPEARQYSGPSANYKREAETRQYSGPSANYKREAEARQYSGPSANYKREAEARQYSGPSANYRRDSDEADVDDE